MARRFAGRPTASSQARASPRDLARNLHGRRGFSGTVPGRMKVLQTHGRRWCAAAARQTLGALLPVLLAAVGGLFHAGSSGGAAPYQPPVKLVPKANPFAARAMWIWELPRSNGGDVAAIIARAKLNGVHTLMIKSGDGTGMWPQFTSTLVRELHAAHLKVCAWQYVYGSLPATEAQVGAGAVVDGADCLLIDAEGEYEGKYISAQTYLKTLRALVGQRFPVALASFPYVDYHPGFPYSVFFGPGGAQYNVPQMYWRDIGVSTDAVFAHTYAFNLIYQRPLFPLGQIYSSPPVHQVLRFRQLSRLYGARGVSWWDWQEGTPRYFHAISQAVGSLPGVAVGRTVASLGLHAQGDVVVWAQEHLYAAGEPVSIDGGFGAATMRAVESFQSAKGLPVSGVVDAPTWAALLRYRPVNVAWVLKRKKVVAVTTRAGRGPRRSKASVIATVPASASLPDRGRDLPPHLGARHPGRR